MKDKLATLVLCVAAAASMATSAPRTPLLQRSLEVEAFRLDDEQERVELKIHVEIPQHELTAEDFTPGGLSIEVAVDPASTGAAIVKLVNGGGDTESGSFVRLGQGANPMNGLNGSYAMSCADGVCAFDALATFDRVAPGELLISGTVNALIGWSGDVAAEVKTPLTEELLIRVER